MHCFLSFVAVLLATSLLFPDAVAAIEECTPQEFSLTSTIALASTYLDGASEEEMRAMEARRRALGRERLGALTLDAAAYAGQAISPSEERRLGIGARANSAAEYRLPLFDLARRSREEELQQMQESSAILLTRKKNEEIGLVASLYSSVRLGDEEVALYQKSISSLIELERVARIRVEEGQGSPRLLRILDMRLQQMTRRLQDAAVTRDITLRQLQALTLPCLIPTPRDSSAHRINPEAIPLRAQVLRQEARQFHVSAQLAKQEQTLTIDALGVFGIHFSRIFDNASHLEYQAGMQLRWQPDATSVRALRSESKKAAAASLIHEAQALEASYRSALLAALEELEHLEVVKGSTTDEIHKARERLAIARLRMEAGVEDIASVLDALMTLNDSHRDSLMYQARRDAILLEFGRLTGDWSWAH